MSVEQIQAKVTAKVWQTIAHSGIDLSGVDKAQLNKLVDMVVDAALEEVDGQLGQQQQTQARAAGAIPFELGSEDDDKEVLLWEGRPFLSLTLNYIITNERVRVI